MESGPKNLCRLRLGRGVPACSHFCNFKPKRGRKAVAEQLLKSNDRASFNSPTSCCQSGPVALGNRTFGSCPKLADPCSHALRIVPGVTSSTRKARRCRFEASEHRIIGISDSSELFWRIHRSANVRMQFLRQANVSCLGICFCTSRLQTQHTVWVCYRMADGAGRHLPRNQQMVGPNVSDLPNKPRLTAV
jgi:hypothetical protein